MNSELLKIIGSNLGALALFALILWWRIGQSDSRFEKHIEHSDEVHKQLFDLAREGQSNTAFLKGRTAHKEPASDGGG